MATHCHAILGCCRPRNLCIDVPALRLIHHFSYHPRPQLDDVASVPENPKNSSANQAAVLSPVEFRYARIILLIALVSVGFGFTVLFAILGPLGREVGMSELQISSIIAASSLVV